MTLRRDTTNRLTLFRRCGICGKSIVTTASTPWMRQIPVLEDGKRRQIITYYCGTTCYQASYKHKGWYDGKADERRAEKERKRDPEAKKAAWKRYYARNGDKLREKRRERYWKNHEEELAENRFSKMKRKILEKDSAEGRNGNGR